MAEVQGISLKFEFFGNLERVFRKKRAIISNLISFYDRKQLFYSLVVLFSIKLILAKLKKPFFSSYKKMKYIGIKIFISLKQNFHFLHFISILLIVSVSEELVSVRTELSDLYRTKAQNDQQLINANVRLGELEQQLRSAQLELVLL